MAQVTKAFRADKKLYAKRQANLEAARKERQKAKTDKSTPAKKKVASRGRKNKKSTKASKSGGRPKGSRTTAANGQIEDILKQVQRSGLDIENIVVIQVRKK